jgi:hypothetical protein
MRDFATQFANGLGDGKSNRFIVGNPGNQAFFAGQGEMRGSWLLCSCCSSSVFWDFAALQDMLKMRLSTIEKTYILCCAAA